MVTNLVNFVGGEVKDSPLVSVTSSNTSPDVDRYDTIFTLEFLGFNVF